MCASLLQCVSHVCNAVLHYVIISTKSRLQCPSLLQCVSHSCTDMPLANTKQLCHTSSVNECVWLRMSYVTRMIQASHSTTILSLALICHSHKASSIWHVIHCVISTNMLSLSPANMQIDCEASSIWHVIHCFISTNMLSLSTANMQIGPICHAHDMIFDYVISTKVLSHST